MDMFDENLGNLSVFIFNFTISRHETACFEARRSGVCGYNSFSKMFCGSPMALEPPELELYVAGTEKGCIHLSTF